MFRPCNVTTASGKRSKPLERQRTGKYKLFGPALCIWDGFHPDKVILAEIDGRNNICTGADINPNKKR